MSEPENVFRAPLPEELAPLFPNYQILSLIATGGMGAVYHAMQSSLEREVAIKILPVEFGNDPEFCEGFVAEAKAMARLNHPNLISVYDFGEVNGMLFIVMEYVPGQSLHEACYGSAVDPAEVIRLLTGICHGLAHAHEYGILHRDIKPANILLDARLQPKIGDFGLARPLDAQLGEGEAIYGTPGYTAPEVLESPHTIDQRADIFSLGVLLHELLTGLSPGSDLASPSAISHCDPRFDAVVRKATHPAPQQRYQDAAEIAAALQKIASTPRPKLIQTGVPTAAMKPADMVYSTQPSNKGGAAALVILPLLAAVAAVLFFRDRIFHNADASPAPALVIVQNPVPLVPDAVVADPQPVTPEPEPMLSGQDPVETGTEPVESGTDIVETGTEPVESATDIVETGPEPVESETGALASETGTESGKSESVTTPQPEFDVEGFLAHARSVMVKRCDPEIVRRDEAIKQNLENFKRDARRLAKTNLAEVYHRAADRELDQFLNKCRENGGRLLEKLESPMKFKKWLVELHKEFHANEAKIDEGMMVALAGQEKTYLHGLGLRVQALREDDPPAADLIQAEIDKVTNSPGYFAGMMLEATQKD